MNFFNSKETCHQGTQGDTLKYRFGENNLFQVIQIYSDCLTISM